MKPRDLILPILVLASCSSPVKKQLEELEEKMEFKKELLVEATKNLFSDSNELTSFTLGLRFHDTLLDYYADRDFEPEWSIYMSDDSSAAYVYTLLENSKYEGFRPNYYHLDSIRKLATDLLELRDAEFYHTMARLELLVADNMLSLHRDRVIGRSDPDLVFGKTYQLPRREFPDFELFSVLNPRKYLKVIETNTNRDTPYMLLTELLKTYYDRVDSGEKWFTIDTAGIRKLEPGDTTNILPQIARKLYLMGVISEKEMHTADSETYNKSFAPYVRRFQQRYGLFDDAIFGRKTFGLLNESLQDRIDQIAANLERIRWFKLPEEPPYIAVNIPAYELQLRWGIKMLEDENTDSISWMKVCVGKARPHDYDERYALYEKEQKYWLRPPDHETPQISSGVVYMVLNPTWTVPRSIITREMYAQMKRDKYYLEKNGYGVFYKGKELRSDSINWSKYSPTKIPFDIVQAAGLENALGRIKFIFPNPFHIYLHDTPQKSKFKWSERAVSHGCVRVENPILMGEFLTQNIKKYNSDDFRIWMGLEPLDEERLEEYDPLDSLAEIQPIDTTHIARLDQRMPVFFMYNTIWFDKEGKVQYRNDVYDKNKYIIRAMDF